MNRKLLDTSYLMLFFLILTFVFSGSAADTPSIKNSNSYYIACIKALSASDTIVRMVRKTPHDISLSNRYINTMLKNKSTEYKKQLLILAAHYGSTAMVNTLINKLNIDPNSTDEFGNTALMRAATRKEHQVIQMLIQHPQIDVNAQNNIGFTALMLAVEDDPTSWAWGQVIHSTNTVLFQQLITKQFSKYDHLTSIEHILDAPSLDTSTKNMYGQTALSLTENSNDEVISSLIKKYERKVKYRNIIKRLKKLLP